MRIALMALLALPVFAQTISYPDPTQLDCPWPKHSFYKQPWRGFLETRNGSEFLKGIGVNYHSPGDKSDDLAIRLLAETGITTARYEVGFGSVKWDESLGLTFNNRPAIERVLGLLKKYNIRPTILLNAHHGVPCPTQFFTRKSAADAEKGAKKLKLADTKGLVVGLSGVNHQSQYWAAAHLITALDASTGEITLSQPLTQPIKAGEDVKMATLKYAPLHPVGTPQFEQTAAAWVRYADRLVEIAVDRGFKPGEMDVEIWNELSFGSNYTDVRRYFEKDDPAAPKGKDFLNPGGCAWELAKRTNDALKAKYPKIRVIWGFSNTTFYHTKIENLPPGMDGQSYHPYGTGSRKLPEKETHKDHPEYNLERFTPTLDIKMPEGWAHTFIQTEGIMRLLNDKARLTAKPQNTPRFYHYITEHGVNPIECGIKDEPAGMNLKALVAARSYLLWMNKGIDVMHFFQAWEKGRENMGILPFEIKELPNDAKWEDVATPPMRAIRTITRAFAGAMPVANPRPISFTLEPLSPPIEIFKGDDKHPPLTDRDVVALLPWQITEKKFIVAAYIMSYDVTQPLPETKYRVTIKGIKPASTTMQDVLTDKMIPIDAPSITDQSCTLTINLTDHPRLITLTEP